MTTKKEQTPRGCPVHGLTQGEFATTTDGSNGPNTLVPHTGEANEPGSRTLVTRSPGLWRPRSPDEYVTTFEYLMWEMIHKSMRYFNRKLREPTKPWVEPWYSWPLPLALAYTYAKLHHVRFQSITSALNFMTTNTLPIVREPREARKFFRTDGKWNADFADALMGASGERFSWNFPPDEPVDVTRIGRSLSEHANILYRHTRLNPETQELEDIEVLAGGRSLLFMGSILWNVHGFFGVTIDRCPINQNPLLLPRSHGQGWVNDQMILDRSAPDTTRVTDDGPPTRRARNHQWILPQVYGATPEEERRLRSFVDGKMKVGDGDLLEDDQAPGFPLIGFKNNLTPETYFLHWLHVVDHNACCDWLKSLEPDWDDERLYQEAKKAIILLNMKNHTLPWTEELLRHIVQSTGMRADWAGLIGERRKMWLMRRFEESKFLNWLGTPLRHSELLYGMLGSKHRHFSGDYGVPTEFRIAYRLHWLLRSNIDLLEHRTNDLIKRFKLLDYIGHNTREIWRTYGKADVVYTTINQECAAPVLHGLPNAIRHFRNQQNAEWTDLGAADLAREYEDGTWSYQRFRRSLGEDEVTSFLELAAGDAVFARELSELYEGDLSKVHVVVGILAEYKAEGNALSTNQYWQFALNAPRRFKSLWLLTDGFNYKTWGHSMDWGIHSGGILGMIRRHVPALASQLEGADRPYNVIRKQHVEFPFRTYQKLQGQTGDLALSDVRTFLMGSVTGLAAIWTGAASPSFVAWLLAAYAAGSLGLAAKRIMVMKDLELCWRNSGTDMSKRMYGTLKDAGLWIDRAAFVGKLAALGVITGGGFMAWHTHAAHPVIAALCGLLALTGFSTRKKSNALVDVARLLDIILSKRMDKPLHYIGTPGADAVQFADAAELEGDNDLERRYMYLKGDNQQPVATLRSCYHQLTTEDQLAPWTAFVTSAMSLVLFGRKTQKDLTWAERWKLGIGFNWFKIYIPGLIWAMSESDTGIYAAVGNTKGLKAGNVDMEEFDLFFRLFAPGRSYVTEYDCARAREWYQARAAREGRGNILTRFQGRLSLKRRHDQAFGYADMVVEEELTCVRAISKEQLLRFYKGTARVDRARKLKEGSHDPRPVAYTNLKALASASKEKLAELYANGKVTALPVGETNGRAIFMPGTFGGRFLSAVANLIWKGKVFGQDRGLVNKILGMLIVKARVSEDKSWSDDGQAIVIDYKNTSWLAFFLRDEIREVADDLYLGKAYVRFGKFAALYFAVDFRTEE